MFDHDQSAARAEMTVRGIYDFEHVGTQNGTNAAQNVREAKLGCAHAYKLFDGVAIKLKGGREYPESFQDYTVKDIWPDVDGKAAMPSGIKGVELNRRVDPR
jgi:CRISPR-associated protein Csd2